MLSESTRDAVTKVVDLMFYLFPDWADNIRSQADKSYTEWLEQFKPFRAQLENSGIFRRSRQRNEDPDELLRFMWTESRRMAGVAPRSAAN
jgi:hypothetical protein